MSTLRVEQGSRHWRVVVVGSGNVAEALAKSLARREGVELCQIFARNEERGRAVAALGATSWRGDVESLAEADIYIIAVSDRAVAEVSRSLRFAPDAIVVHTAGSVAMTALDGCDGRRGILYAFQSFTAGREVSFDELPIFIEAESEAVAERLQTFAERLSSRVYYADSALRRRIHLAGVFVNNFVNHLYAIGRDVVTEAGLPYEVLHPLMEETLRKATAVADPCSVQTGPAVRGDVAVCDMHRAMLAATPKREDIYKDLTESIWETSKRI